MAKATRIKINREQLQAARAKRSEARKEVILADFTADLRESGQIGDDEDFTVELRKINLNSTTVYFGAPDELSRKVLRRTISAHETLDFDATKMTEIEIATFAADKYFDQDFCALVDVVCLAAIADPLVVETEEELAAHPDAILLSDLSRDDRASVFAEVQSMSVPEASAEAERFPGGNEQAADADVGSAAAGEDAAPSKRRAKAS